MAIWAREIPFYFDGTQTIDKEISLYKTTGRGQDASKLEIARQIMQKNIAKDTIIGKRA